MEPILVILSDVKWKKSKTDLMSRLNKKHCSTGLNCISKEVLQNIYKIYTIFVSNLFL